MHQLKSCFSSLSCNYTCQCYSTHQSLTEMFWHRAEWQDVSLEGSVLLPNQSCGAGKGTEGLGCGHPTAQHLGCAHWGKVLQRNGGSAKVSCGRGQHTPECPGNWGTQGDLLLTEKLKVQSRDLCPAQRKEFSLLLEDQPLAGIGWSRMVQLTMVEPCCFPAFGSWGIAAALAVAPFCCQNHTRKIQRKGLGLLENLPSLRD